MLVFFIKKNSDKSSIVISDLHYLIRRMIENQDKFLGPKNLIFNSFCLKTPLNIIWSLKEHLTTSKHPKITLKIKTNRIKKKWIPIYSKRQGNAIFIELFSKRKIHWHKDRFYFCVWNITNSQLYLYFAIF